MPPPPAAVPPPPASHARDVRERDLDQVDAGDRPHGTSSSTPAITAARLTELEQLTAEPIARREHGRNPTSADPSIRPLDDHVGFLVQDAGRFGDRRCSSRRSGSRCAVSRPSLAAP